MRGRPALAWALFINLACDVPVALTLAPGLLLAGLMSGAQPALAFKLLLVESASFKDLRFPLLKRYSSFFVREPPEKLEGTRPRAPPLFDLLVCEGRPWRCRRRCRPRAFVLHRRVRRSLTTLPSGGAFFAIAACMAAL